MHIKLEKLEGRQRNRPLKDYTGMVFGRLTAVALHERYPDKPPKWRFSCLCGGEVVTMAKQVVSGKTQSCGCIAREVLIARNTKHGLSRQHPHLYKVWKDMKSRCGNPKNKEWHNYGGRGVRVCEQWDKDFAQFFADVGLPPEGMTIDRIDVNGNYEPSNVRWATIEQQMNNRRSNRWVEYAGRKQTLAQWCKEMGVDRTKAAYRLSVGLDPFFEGDFRK